MPITGMPVEDWEARRIRDTESGRTAERVFTVVFDEGDEPAIRPLLALQASGIPARGSKYPGWDSMECYEKGVEPFEGPLTYKVTCRYKTIIRKTHWSFGSGGEKPPLEVEWGFVTSAEAIDRDIDGKVITNSAGESFDPPITKDIHDLNLRIVREQDDFNQSQAAEYMGAINSDSFMGFDEGQVMCTAYNGRRVYRDDGSYYWQVTYEFQFRNDEIIGEGIIGWKRRILDQGYRENWGKKEDGSPDLRNILDENGQKVSEPVLLNKYGRKLPGEPNTEEYIKNAKFLKFDVYRKLPFSVLGIGV